MLRAEGWNDNRWSARNPPQHRHNHSRSHPPGRLQDSRKCATKKAGKSVELNFLFLDF